MNTNSENSPASDPVDRSDWAERLDVVADPKVLLEDVVSGLQILCAETSASSSPTAAMIELHAALLLFELGGRRELLPSIGLGVSSRRILERRIVSSARSLAGQSVGSDAAFAAWNRAADRIEDLIDLIDPELRFRVAS